MAKNQTYRAFVTHPSHVLDLNGELLETVPVMSQLVSEVRDISAYATYVTRNDTQLGDDLVRVTATAPAEAGRQAGVMMPDFLASGRGKSRKERLLRYNVVTSYRSWQERIDAVNGESSKYVSLGWKRTMNKGVNTLSSPARVQVSRVDTSVLADCLTYGVAGTTSHAAIKQGTITKYRLCSPI